MPSFKFTEEQYLKMVDEAINRHIDSMQSGKLDMGEALARMRESIKNRKLAKPVRTSQV